MTINFHANPWYNVQLSFKSKNARLSPLNGYLSPPTSSRVQATIKQENKMTYFFLFKSDKMPPFPGLGSAAVTFCHSLVVMAALSHESLPFFGGSFGH